MQVGQTGKVRASSPLVVTKCQTERPPPGKSKLFMLILRNKLENFVGVL